MLNMFIEHAPHMLEMTQHLDLAMIVAGGGMFSLVTYKRPTTSFLVKETAEV